MSATTSLPASSEVRRLSLTASLLCLALFAAAYITNAMDRQVFSMLLPWITKTHGYNLKAGGLLSTIFTLGIGCAAIPSGYLLDRWSRKSVLVLGMIIYSLFTLATIFATGFLDMLFYRAMTGVGEGMQIAALFAAAGSYFYKSRALVIGSINLGYGIGAVLGPFFATRLTVMSNDWHVAFVVFALLGFGMAAAISFAIPKAFSESKALVQTAALDSTLLLHMPERFLNRNLILCSIAAMNMGVISYGHLSLYPTFLIKQLHFAPTTAGLIFGFWGFGAMLGIPAGWIGDHLRTRWVIIAVFCCTSTTAYLVYNVATQVWQQFILSFTMALFCSSFFHPNMLAMSQRSVRPEMVGRATGVFTSCTFLAASLSGFVLGALIGHLGWGGAARVQLCMTPIIGITAMLLIKESQLCRILTK